jgi:hypothetical protein
MESEMRKSPNSQTDVIALGPFKTELSGFHTRQLLQAAMIRFNQPGPCGIGFDLHAARFRNLVVAHIQLDELVNKVRRAGYRVWVWTADDVLSKAWLARHIGRRTQADAHRVVHQVVQRLASGCVPVFSSDGLRQYFYALTAHFGRWTQPEGKRRPRWQVLPKLLYGQLRRMRSGYHLKYVHTKVLCGTHANSPRACGRSA